MKKRILITGATGGIGKMVSSKMLAEGYQVILHGNSNYDSILDLMEKHPDDCEWFQCDLSDYENIQSFKSLAGQVDAIIHCAGIPSAGMSWKVDSNEFKRVQAINLEAPFFISQIFIPEMRKRNWGRIVFFSSIVAQTGIPGTSAYAASKSALFGLTRTLAAELAPNGISVNCIAPGYMDQGMIREISESMREKIIAKTPIAKLSDTQGIVKLVEMLLSDEANSITGQVLSVNGGMWM